MPQFILRVGLAWSLAALQLQLTPRRCNYSSHSTLQAATTAATATTAAAATATTAATSAHNCRPETAVVCLAA